jgi:hypothetical protein
MLNGFLALYPGLRLCRFLQNTSRCDSINSVVHVGDLADRLMWEMTFQDQPEVLGGWFLSTAQRSFAFSVKTELRNLLMTSA